jgi:hypothetical protein
MEIKARDSEQVAPEIHLPHLFDVGILLIECALCAVVSVELPLDADTKQELGLRVRRHYRQELQNDKLPVSDILSSMGREMGKEVRDAVDFCLQQNEWLANLRRSQLTTNEDNIMSEDHLRGIQREFLQAYYLYVYGPIKKIWREVCIDRYREGGKIRFEQNLY